MVFKIIQIETSLVSAPTSSSSEAFATPMSLSHSQASVSEVVVVRKDSAPLVTTDSLSASSCSPLELEIQYVSVC